MRIHLYDAHFALLIFLVFLFEAVFPKRLHRSYLRDDLVDLTYSSWELVPLPDSTVPSEFQDNRSSTVSASATNIERHGVNIGRDALSRKKNFCRADHTILWEHPSEFTTTGFGAFGNALEETRRTVWAMPSPTFWCSSTDGNNAKRLRQAEDPWNNVTWTAGNHEETGE